MEESKRSKFRRICVFCGSNSGLRKVFRDAALELGNELCFYSGVSELGHDMGFASIICHAYEIRVLAERAHKPIAQMSDEEVSYNLETRIEYALELV
ncbi:hypothetical protein EV1_038510 [Malus domestica]